MAASTKNGIGTFRAISKVLIGKHIIYMSNSYAVQYFRRFAASNSVNQDKGNCHGTFTLRTHTCGELRPLHVGQRVSLCAWLQFKRMSKFLILRDAYGTTQVSVSEDHPKEKEISKLIDELALESVVKVVGTVVRRPAGQENEKMETGSIEVCLEDIDVVGRCDAKLPFIPRDFNKANEQLRLKYRYLDMRSSELQRNLRLRSEVVMKIREYLCRRNGFVDVETPTLFKRTPGGAQEFVVPTRHKGLFYSLTQSPQQFKQLLMIGSMDRYFQIARCYRDETSRPDRQPEFTQVDIEMSFVTPDGIVALIEGLLAHCWPDHLPSVAAPFRRMSYLDAIRDYGTDKPDTRFDMKLVDVPDCLTSGVVPFLTATTCGPDFGARAFVSPRLGPLLAKSFQERLRDEARNKYLISNLAFIKVNTDLQWTSTLKPFLDVSVVEQVNEMLHLQADDVVILCAGNANDVNRLLAKLRLDIATVLENAGIGLGRSPDDQHFLWIVDFPLFQLTKEGAYESSHHPFTAPHPADANLLFSGGDLTRVRGQHFDLVLNGAEIAGGSIRIHDAKLQRYILEDILKEDPSGLSHLLDALASGCPPHGGIAIGLDRLLAIMCRATSIRDVIAFPKSVEGRDLMSGAPAPLVDKEKELYHLVK